MDLSSIMNNGPEPEKDKNPSSQSSGPATGGGGFGEQRASAPRTTSMSPPRGAANGRSESLTPGIGPPPSNASTPGQSRGLTSLQAHLHMPAGGPPPYHPQSLHSPLSTLARTVGRTQYMPHDRSPVLTPGGNPMALVYQQSPPPSTHIGASPVYQSTSKSSASPTPLSHHSQTPHAIRPSPLPGMSYTSGSPASMHQSYSSHPPTPLGPPPPIRKPSIQPEIASPHQRTLSGTSNGLVSQSPAQYHPSIGNLLDSPEASKQSYSRSTTASGSGTANDRERSLSVSPKTILHPRPPSSSSQHSGPQEVHSGRNSLQSHTNASSPGTLSGQSNMHSQIPQQHRLADGGIPQAGPNASVHQQQKIGLNHLLSSALEPVSSGHQPTRREEQAAKTHAYLDIKANGALPSRESPTIKSETTVIDSGRMAADSNVPSISNDKAHLSRDQKAYSPQTSLSSSKPSLKRPAEFEPAAEPALKRERRRKFTERPVWAQISAQNQRYASLIAQDNANRIHPQPQRQQSSGPPSRQQANGSSANLPPWRQDPPLDGDLIHARNILGRWEKSFRWHTPIPSMVAAVQDWIFKNLEACADVGTDPREGTIEIEAKIGTLIHHGESKRCALPVASATVIHPAANKNYRFESQMEESEHKKMNEFLNSTLMASREKGRVPIEYRHLRETDSFRTLSEPGLQMLPQTAHKRPFGRELKLRTTVDDKTHAVKARIVKIPLADLHIFNPADPYDCRISMNLEVNMLDRPGADDLAALTLAPTDEKPAPPDRHKDRLSYQHLAYAIDLTRVDVRGVAPSFELELEMDAVLLRQQMQRLKNGEPNAFGNVIESFLDNCTFLMRQRS